MADVAVDPECSNPKELFGQGVRAFVLQDYENAVAALSKTSELLVVEHKDDLHDSLGEVYLYYGKALLGLAREQNEALGDAVPKNSAEDSEEDEEPDEGIESEESEKNKTADNSSSSSVNGDAGKTASKPDERKIKEQSNEDNNTGLTENNTKMETNGKQDAKWSNPEALLENSEPGPSCSMAGDEETIDEQQNGDDDTTDLQLAWEVLELAKKIFQKLDEKKSLADTLIVLGEVSLESENFESAINDINQGLGIQKELFSKDSRTVAETLYKLGMAYSTNSQLDEAIDSFNNSLEYLRNRIKSLEEIKSLTQEHKDEVEEIKSLIPDIEDKIADMKTYKEEAIKRVAEAFKEPSKPIQDDAGSSKQVSNISHLVKRKRKLDEALEDKPNEEVSAKKPAV